MPEGTPRPRVAAAVFEVVLDGHSSCPQKSACDDPPNPSQVRIIVTTPPGPAGNRRPAPLALVLSHEDLTRIFLLRKHAQHRELLGLNIDKWIAYRALAQVVGMFIP